MIGGGWKVQLGTVFFFSCKERCNTTDWKRKRKKWCSREVLNRWRSLPLSRVYLLLHFIPVRYRYNSNTSYDRVDWRTPLRREREINSIPFDSVDKNSLLPRQEPNKPLLPSPSLQPSNRALIPRWLLAIIGRLDDHLRPIFGTLARSPASQHCLVSCRQGYNIPNPECWLVPHWTWQKGTCLTWGSAEMPAIVSYRYRMSWASGIPSPRLLPLYYIPAYSSQLSLERRDCRKMCR